MFTARLPLYEPQIGRSTIREWDGYSAKQDRRWQALADVYFACKGGYLHTRYPTPGRVFDAERFEAWRDKCIDAWAGEANSRTASKDGRSVRYGGIRLEDLPKHTWLYFYERMLDA